MQEEEDNRRHIKDTVYVGRTDREGETVSLGTESSGDTVYKNDDEVVVLKDETDVEVSESKSINNLSSYDGGGAYVIDSSTKITTSADKVISNAKASEIMKNSWSNSLKSSKYKLATAPFTQFNAGLGQGAADVTFQAIKNKISNSPEFTYEVEFSYKLNEDDVNSGKFKVKDVSDVKGLYEKNTSAVRTIGGKKPEPSKDGITRTQIEFSRILVMEDIKDIDQNVTIKKDVKPETQEGSLFQIYQKLRDSPGKGYSLSASVELAKRRWYWTNKVIITYSIHNIKIIGYTWERDSKSKGAKREVLLVTGEVLPIDFQGNTTKLSDNNIGGGTGSAIL